MTPEIPYWINLTPTVRQQMRAAYELKEFRACVRELTAVPLEEQVMAENEYLFAENRLFYNRLSKNDTVLIHIPLDNCRILYRHARKLHECHRHYMTLFRYDDLRIIASDYEKDPPSPKKNSISLDMEQLIVDMALENPLWGVPHIMTSMRNIGYWETKMHHVTSALKRNYIPTSKLRRSKGVSWDYLLPTLQMLLAEDDDFSSRFVKLENMPKNPYSAPHKRLMKFIRTAKISPNTLELNRYLRMENTILTGYFYRKNKELHLTIDEKRQLAKPASKLHGLNKRQVPLLTPSQIVQYCRKQTAKKYSSKCPTKTRGKADSDLLSVRQLPEFLSREIEANRIKSRQEAVQLVHKHFGKKIPVFRILNVLYDLGYFTERKKRNGISWREFKKTYADVTWAGDFFTVEVLSKYGILTYQVMFFVHLGSGEVFIAGASPHATSEWVISKIKQWTDADSPFGTSAKFLIRDCDRRYTKEVDWYFTSIGVLPRKITPAAPVMNCQAEIFVRQIKHECLNQLPIFSEHQLKMLLENYQLYYNTQRPNIRAKGGYIHKDDRHWRHEGEIVKESLLPGILNFYYREAA